MVKWTASVDIQFDDPSDNGRVDCERAGRG